LPPPPRGKTNGLSNMLNQSFSAKHSRFSLRPAAKSEDSESRPTTADSSTKHNKLHKQRERMPSGSSGMDNFRDHAHLPELPEDLKVILDVLGHGVLDGHLNLADQLRKRYDDQYPLVRSLTDIFIANVSRVSRPRPLEIRSALTDACVIRRLRCSTNMPFTFFTWKRRCNR
jgi:hypothetical protein